MKKFILLFALLLPTVLVAQDHRPKQTLSALTAEAEAIDKLDLEYRVIQSKFERIVEEAGRIRGLPKGTRMDYDRSTRSWVYTEPPAPVSTANTTAPVGTR